jgi:hypothetical protein
LSQRQQGGTNINTADQTYMAMAQAGIQGVQSEIQKFGQGFPDITVTVPAGTEFTILLTQGFELK